MKIVSDLDLTPYNSYRVNAVCKTAYFPDNEEDIRQVLSGDPAEKIVIGSGHNIIFSKRYYDRDFVFFSGNFNAVSVNENEISAQAGISMLELSEIALANELSGLEIFYDIPSSLGGAVVMNAGASGEDIKDVLVKVRYYDPLEDKFSEISKEEINFEYRNSFFQKNPQMIVCQVWLKLKPGSRDTILKKMNDIKDARWAKQPRDYPNAGSVFKRPVGYYVGAMMDELALKGYTVGGAKISEKHGGFIINFNNASGQDILDIISVVKTKVLEKFGVDIEVEQRVV